MIVTDFKKFNGNTLDDVITYLQVDLRRALNETNLGFRNLSLSQNHNDISIIDLAQNDQLVFNTEANSWENGPTLQTWTPSFFPSGSMTFTAITINEAIFEERANNLVWLSLNVSGTIGGTPSNTIQFDAPTSVVESAKSLSAHGDFTSGVTQGGFAISVASTNRILVREVNVATWAAGNLTFVVTGEYQKSG